ncbi:MAG: 4Fe-4S binding protein [Cyanobacteriota bacterium]|nr:4Fe-4S binding protein [Cyanobacteriota bacterium]
MLNNVSEQKMHSVRLVLTLGWLVLIFSLFYDPVSHYLTDPNTVLSPFRDRLACVPVQGKCLEEAPYPMGTRIFWGMVVPSAIMILLVFGHETWRRICPLYFLSQIPRALGLKPLLDIRKNQFLAKNHLYVQFALLFVGLNGRILLLNSERLILGLFLLLTIFSAMTMVFFYGGRSWCHYICPFGIVQTVFTGPRGLLGKEAHTIPKSIIPQSECRTFDKDKNREKRACINCKTNCIDKDAEKSYWHYLNHPGRKLVQYGYLGLVIGYFVYYGLYSGNFDYYFSGSWTHEPSQIATLFSPGFYLWGRSIPIPKLVASPLTLGFFVAATCLICTQLEKRYRVFLRRQNPTLTREQVLHRVFSICTFLAFNTFFIYGGRPEILRLPLSLQFLFEGFAILVSSLWLYRAWGRSVEQYNRERLTHSFRRELQKFPIDFAGTLEGRSLEQLRTDELYILARVLPQVSRQERFSIYQGVLQDALEEERFKSAHSLEALKPFRQQLGLNDEDHYTILTRLGSKHPQLLYPQECDSK